MPEQEAARAEQDLTRPAALESIEPEVVDVPEIKPADSAAFTGAAEPAAPPETKKFEHTPGIASLAADLGISPEEIQTTPPETLHHTVRHLSRAAAQRAYEAGQAQAPQPVQQQQGPDPFAVDWGADDTGKPYTEKDYAPAVARAMKSERETARKFAHLEWRMQQAQQFSQQNQTQSLIEAAESHFAGNASRYGKGRGEHMAQHDPNLVRRQAIFNLAHQFQGSPAERLKAAEEALYGPSKAAEEAAEKIDLKRRWQEGGLARTTSRAAKEPKGILAAKKAFLQGLAEVGYDENGLDENDSLPG